VGDDVAGNNIMVGRWCIVEGATQDHATGAVLGNGVALDGVVGAALVNVDTAQIFEEAIVAHNIVVGAGDAQAKALVVIGLVVFQQVVKRR
jgi:NO-binding membrane sensor protein with MHYT domain